MIPQAFSRQSARTQQDRAAEIDELHRQLEQVIAEQNWLKKSPAVWRSQSPEVAGTVPGIQSASTMCSAGH